MKHTFVGMEIISVQKLMKLMALHLEGQTDTIIHDSDCCSQHGRRGHVESQTEGNGANKAGRHQVNFSK
jgi:hypothetical protein